MEGFIVDSEKTMYAFGGWFETNVWGSKIAFSQNGTDLIEFDGNSRLNYYHKFYGMIDTDGFTHIEVHELEGVTDDRKHIFADDLVMATGNKPANPAPNDTPVDVTSDTPLEDLALVESELSDHADRIGYVPVIDDVLSIFEDVDKTTVTSILSLTAKGDLQISITATTYDGSTIQMDYTVRDTEDPGKYEEQISEEDDYTLYEAADDSFILLLLVF